MRATMYMKYTTRSLWRGGQRTLLAIFCVAVGVMAIVALQLVGLMIDSAFNSNVRDANGGDIAVRSQSQPFKEDELSFFDDLRKKGQINDYTPVINAQGTTGAEVSVRESFAVRVIDAEKYPLVTPPTFVEPADGTIESLVKNVQVVVTAPFIEQSGRKIGDHFTLHIAQQGRDSLKIEVELAGIVSETGVLAQSGSVVLLSFTDYQTVLEKQKEAEQPELGNPELPGGVENPQPGNPELPEGVENPQVEEEAPAAGAVLYDTINIDADEAQHERVTDAIEEQFPLANVQTAADALRQQQALIDNIRKFLEIAGLLALLIGGVGIVNTMQVLLSRRKTEIAMLKTTGYRRLDLYLLFGLEAGLLGLVGGMLGAGAAIGVSYAVRNLVVQNFGLNIPFLLDWFTIGGGVVIGLVTALIFGLLPIVQAANIRPLNVIRDLPEGRGAGSFLLTGGLLLLLSVLFCGLAIVILHNDVVLGLVAVYGVFIFLGLLSLFFGLLIFSLGKLPVPERYSPTFLLLVAGMVALSILLYLAMPAFGLLLLGFSLLGLIVVPLPRTMKASTKMALRNLDRRRARTTTTMVALFVGIFTIGLVIVLGQNLRTQVNEAIAGAINYNAFVITADDDIPRLQKTLEDGEVPGLQNSEYHTVASTAPVEVNEQPVSSYMTQEERDVSPTSLGRLSLRFLSGLEGFDVANGQLPDDDALTIVEGRNLQASDAGTDNVLLPFPLSERGPFRLDLQDTITLTNIDRSSTHTVTVVGFYRIEGFGGSIYPIIGTMASVDALSMSGTNQAVFYLKIDPEQVSNAVEVLGRTVPDAFILNLANIGDFINELLNNVLLTLTTIASLSLVAGLIIIANAVALAMLERRRELGILKSVGYTSRTILSEVLLENGLVGGMSAMLSMLLVSLATFLLGRLAFNVNFQVDPVVAISMVLGAALLAMITAALVAWQAVRVRPLEVLRYE